MLTRLSIEVDREELKEFREVLDKLVQEKPVVEVKLNPYIRGICRQIIRDIDRWEDFKKERW